VQHDDRWRSLTKKIIPFKALKWQCVKVGKALDRLADPDRPGGSRRAEAMLA
jgi:hypothetical protein